VKNIADQHTLQPVFKLHRHN